jgi:hypothetical protein
MSTYLELAERVLREHRKPMTAIQILRAIYENGWAPAHLHGRTQHKTLQARLSEDILELREKSRFYRTAPGRYFLRAFLNDPAIPERERAEITARRRRRDLPATRPLTVVRRAMRKLPNDGTQLPAKTVIGLLQKGLFRYPSTIKQIQDDEIAMWAAVLVIKSSCVLTYRLGRYRDDRDSFAQKRSIGFYSPVREDDLTLFDRLHFGILERGLRTLMMDLDVHDEWLARVIHENTDLKSFVRPISGDDTLLAIIAFDCPSDVEPTSGRLAINELQWLDLTTPLNNLDDFDPWSRAMLGEARRIAINAS